MTVGVGAGQMNRVGAAHIAVEQAGEKAWALSLLPTRSSQWAIRVELAAKAGITAIIQPGGSIKDEESIAVANANNIAMVFTRRSSF